MIALTEQERQILSLVTPVAEQIGMEIVRLRIQGGRRPHLQIMAERAGGAPTNVEDCASLSRAIAPMLDEADPIKEAYTLEVSTPGIDRPLTREGDFGRWVGHAAKVELVRPIDGRRRFSGMITGEDEDGAHLELDDETELVAHVHEMSKASLILTDELIEAARADGTLPPQPDEDDLGDLEIDETDEDTDTNEETGDVK
ncbi:MAG: ribosome maturation factor RimP [Hyphomonas sp.]|uniref:Ribosome maturation factor RimP n=2 Tax=Hyphomonas atlantica TaxID=1280948 RepID=A0A059E9V0_9PROT|nr:MULTISPECIES: ribosome maturation factor RimP [Hyphomonas]KCZ64466.1 ribosome maturation factor RimP [Hyphomonas atlantica]MAH91546.1 ribosome maturation factor RimP [Hyphomonas sp.]MAM06015.1 ribosome maturation factor RimP [Hyphomonas sp.]HAE93188.1 ribosome maturation factor RimP [Hyphomonas atlantica]HBF90071.1 ribosome maturation factor RimP [Hyphomonas atlantica]|tara:strand:+ start:594 stop:1193 length:600 start_codon:yes stop_codon:yes gene_type:complete